MSKIALITDIHFCVRNSSLYFMKRQRLFFENIFFPYLEKHGIKTILCLGDTFEDRKQINILGLHNSREMFFDVAKAKNIKIISILGNHCVYFKNTNQMTELNLFLRFNAPSNDADRHSSGDLNLLKYCCNESISK